MDLQHKISNVENNQMKKSCSDCQTTRTPLWRGGPAGPKSLCNACGIKYHKKRREVLGLDRARKNRINKKQNMNKSGNNNEVGRSMKMRRLIALGKEMGLKISSSTKFGEEEEAAVLLMALSYGSLSSVFDEMPQQV